MFQEIVVRLFERFRKKAIEEVRIDWVQYEHVLHGPVPPYEKSGGVGTDKYLD